MRLVSGDVFSRSAACGASAQVREGGSPACMRLPTVQKRRMGENIEANDSARSPKFLAHASWPDRNCRLSERPDESTAAAKAAEMREGAS